MKNNTARAALFALALFQQLFYNQQEERIMSFKKTLSALLCALFLVTAVVPVMADEGILRSHASSYNEPLNGIGVQAFYSCSFSGNAVTGAITLSYLSDPSNHLPASDYTTYITFKVWDIYGGYTECIPMPYGNMTYNRTVTTGTLEDVDHARCLYYVNGNYKHTLYLS